MSIWCCLMLFSQIQENKEYLIDVIDDINTIYFFSLS